MTESQQSMEYIASEYQAPQILRSLGSILRAPRQVYTTNFASAFSDDAGVQHSYARGIIAVGSFFLALLVLWGFVIVVLKLRGKEVGCASGRAFQMVKADDDDELQVTDSSSGDFSMGDDNSSSAPSRYDMEELGQEVMLSDYGSEDYDNEVNSRGSWTEDERQQKVPDLPQMKENPRERKTRSCFLFFSILSLCLVPFILIFSFGPMKEATDASKQLILLAHEVIDATASSFELVKDAAASSQAILDTMPQDLGVICPLVDPNDMETELGIDLGILHGIAIDGFRVTSDLVDTRLSFFYNAMAQMQNGSIAFEEHIQEAESFMWIVPGLLFTVSILSALAMLGSVLAWKQKSGDRIEFALSYLLLPTLIVVSIGCWIIVAMASFGAMITSDICTPVSIPTSPETTIHDILTMRHRNENDTVHQFVDFYTNGCKGSKDPTEYITDLERRVQENVDEIWRQISIIDSIGRAKLLTDCGGDYLVDFVSGSRNVAKLLTTMRRSLRSASGHLECDRLNPIYTEIVHDALCTDAASASSYGCVLFFILAISTMAMISLRTSWLQSIGEEEKIYHDEDEIAENMVVDEHEEYLKYISKYKHEWQEYNGFENGGSSPVPQTNHSFVERNDRLSQMHYAGAYSARNFMDPVSVEETCDRDDGSGADGESSRTDGEGYQGSDEFSDVSSPAGQKGLKVDVIPTSMFKAPSTDESIDDISYPSLKNKSYDSASIDGADKAPRSLLPPPENPDYKDDFEMNQELAMESSAPNDRNAIFRERQEPEGIHVRACEAVQGEVLRPARRTNDSDKNDSFNVLSEPEKGRVGRKEGGFEDFGTGLPSTPESDTSIDLWL